MDAVRQRAEPATPCILFCGEVQVQILLPAVCGRLGPDREVLCADFRMEPGSSAALAAFAHARLGGATAFAGLGGDDVHGGMVRDWLAGARVDTRHLALSRQQRTGVTVNILQADGRYQATFPGARPSYRPDIPAIIADGRIRHVHLSGVHPQSELSCELPDILAALAGRGIGTSLDPHWAASGDRDRLDGWMPSVDTLFCTEAQACAMARMPACDEAMRRLAAHSRQVVVRRASGRVDLRTAAGAWSCPAFEVDVRDTIGAGENLAAAWLFATLTAGFDPVAALRFAGAAAARSSTFPGGTMACSTASDIRSFLAACS